jgi:DNA mismatch repair ATPase MutS
VPNEVIRRAKEVLSQVEQTAKALQTPSVAPKAAVDDGMISMEDIANEQVLEELKAVDLNTLSPYEAMSFLFNLKKKLL